MLYYMNTKTILYENVLSLMEHNYGKSNLWKLCEECKLAPATGTRIKKQETSVGLDVLEAIAKRFNLQPWHLLVPKLDPTNPPVILITDAERSFYKRMKEMAALIKQ